LTQQQIENGV